MHSKRIESTLARPWPLWGIFPAAALPSLKRIAIFLTTALWLTLGLLGRDPWKPDEAYTFGLVYHILNTGDWVVPTLAGEPFMEKPPLFFISAALCAKLFGSVLSLHDAARLSTAFYVGLTLLFVGLAARRLYGVRQALGCALILLGCVGYVHSAHLLITDNSLVAGIAIGIYGLSLVLQQPIFGGLLLGTGAGIAFLSKGMIGPGMLGLTAVALLVAPAWRTRAYGRGLAVAAAAFAPWALVWPWLLYQRSPELFHEWFIVNNFGRYSGSAKLGPTHDHLMYLKILPWFALPALPLAAWNAYALRNKAIMLPLIAALVMLGVLSSACNSREVYALPMFVPLALLAGAATPPRWLAKPLYWTAAVLAAAAALACWAGLAALLAGWRGGLADALFAWRPGFVPSFEPQLFLLAVAVTLAGCIAIWAWRRSACAVAVSWLAMTAIGWGLLMTLWLPYFEYGNSYRSVVGELKAHLPQEPGCIANRSLGEPQRAMLEYLGGIVTHRENILEAQSCKLLLVQQQHTQEIPEVGALWTPVWSGNRPGDLNERFWLFRRADMHRIAR
jgi:4-amino-4-deoxy-L-arabinose transferase-like glycosyltransferase